MSVEELKEVSSEINSKVNAAYHFGALQSSLLELDKVLKEIDAILIEEEMEGLSYSSQETEINSVSGDIGLLNAYIGTMETEALESLDKPLYKGFNLAATEGLSLVKLEDYTTENRLGIKTHKVMYDRHGNRVDHEAVKDNLTMEDFLGLTAIKEGKLKYIVNMPKEFEEFTNLFAMDYNELIKSGQLGKDVSLEAYLTYVKGMGDFEHEMDKPFLQFLSDVLDVTIIKPIIEACTGYDMVTKEELSDLDRGLNVVFAVIDIVTLLVGIKASGILKPGVKGVLKFAGKTIALDALASGSAYGISKVCEEIGLPLPLTLILSGMGGVSVSVQGGKYIFKNSADEVIQEISQEAIEKALKSDWSQYMSPEDAKRYNKYWDDLVEGASGAKTPKSKYKPIEYEGSVKVNGEVRDVSRRVYQRNDININYIDEATGLTNLERMQKGKPPIGPDGNPIQLHHILQKESGPMVEIQEITHQEYFSQLHGLIEDGASFRNNPILNKQYNNFRNQYWKWRASQFIGG